jgi:hypothetical protein
VFSPPINFPGGFPNELEAAQVRDPAEHTVGGAAILSLHDLLTQKNQGRQAG